MTVLFTTINYCPLEPVFENEDKRYIYSHKLILVSGIASDTPLRRYLSDSYDIVKHFKFNDHHKYTALDISRITGADQQMADCTHRYHGERQPEAEELQKNA